MDMFGGDIIQSTTAMEEPSGRTFWVLIRGRNRISEKASLR